jgi:hypothetical protein
MSGAIREVNELNDYSASTVVPARAATGDTEPAPPPALTDADETAKFQVAPAGIVRIPGEELFEAIESEEDIVKANRELLEGREQTAAETEQWTRLYNEVLQEANKRLAPKGIVLLAAACEPRGLGAVMTGVDKAAMEAAGRGFMVPSEDYTVTISLPAKERVDLMAAGRESFVRWLIDLVVGECIEQQRAYRAVARMH